MKAPKKAFCSPYQKNQTCPSNSPKKLDYSSQPTHQKNPAGLPPPTPLPSYKIHLQTTRSHLAQHPLSTQKPHEITRKSSQLDFPTSQKAILYVLHETPISLILTLYNWAWTKKPCIYNWESKTTPPPKNAIQLGTKSLPPKFT